jgi:hypothetical protein
VPAAIEWANVGAALLAVRGDTGDHAVLAYTDPRTGDLQLYEPEVGVGPATTRFATPDAFRQYLEGITTHQFPGRIVLMAQGAPPP